jgi:hypothetical protein
MNLINELKVFRSQTLKANKLQSALLIRFFKDVQPNTITTDQLKAYLETSIKHVSFEKFLIHDLKWFSK